MDMCCPAGIFVEWIEERVSEYHDKWVVEYDDSNAGFSAMFKFANASDALAFRLYASGFCEEVIE